MVCTLVPLFTRLLSMGLLHGAEMRVIPGREVCNSVPLNHAKFCSQTLEHRQLLKYHTQQEASWAANTPGRG